MHFQGQAISVLVRAYLETKDDRFLKAAEDGVKVFNISSSEGGVRAVFMVSPKYFVLPDIVRLKVERNYILDGAWAPFW